MGLKVHQDGFKSIDYQEWRRAVLKHNGTRDQITQAMTHTQRHVNNAWSEMTTSNPCLALHCIFLLGSYNEYGISDLSFFHKPYEFI
jgi:hypothetical protein